MPDTSRLGSPDMSKQGDERSDTAIEETFDQCAVRLARHSGLVLIKDTPKGRGIFTTTLIPARTTVEASPVLVLSPEENAQHISKTQLWFYTYNWPLENGQTQALPLGLGSLFNHASTHSRQHNTGFMRNVADQTISYITLRDIEAGEELCVCYGEDTQLGFADADSTAQEYEPYHDLSDGAGPGISDRETDMKHIDASIFSG